MRTPSEWDYGLALEKTLTSEKIPRLLSLRPISLRRGVSAVTAKLWIGRAANNGPLKGIDLEHESPEG